MQNLLQPLGWALVNSLWQMALLWVIFQFIILSIRGLRPRHKATLAVAMTFTGFAWFVFTFITSAFNSEKAATVYPSGLINETNWNYFMTVVLPYITVTYLAILIIPVWQFIRNYRFVQIIRTSGLQKMDVAWRLYVKRTATAIGIAKEVKIWLSDWVNSPVTIGYLKPVILIPFAALNNLTTSQLEAVILHELSHIARHDYFINLILSFIKTVLYFNPFVKSFVKTIEREREYSCDEMVLQFQYKPGEYASALLRLEQNKYRQMVMAASGKNHDLLHRIEAILGMRNKGWQPLRRLSSALLTLIGVSLLHVFISINKNENPPAYSLHGELSPYYFMNGKEQPAEKSFSKPAAATSTAEQKQTPGVFDYSFTTDYSGTAAAPASPFVNVNYTTPVFPELSEEAEYTVKEAMTATRKILEEKEWKELEKKYAEVYNSKEKDLLKAAYLDEINKVDWKKLEEQLRLSYEQINWNTLQEKINSSLTQIKMDSVKHALNINLKNLDLLEKAMNENNVVAIPDTEICIETIHQNQQKAEAQLQKLKAIQTKKTIRL
jgi:beta-lactamase regulating signal transducer with metallopeptidase domain